MVALQPLLDGFEAAPGDDDDLFDDPNDDDGDEGEDDDELDDDIPDGDTADELTVYASQGVVVMQPPGDPEARLVYTEGQARVLATMLRQIEAQRLAMLLEDAASRSHFMGTRARPGRMY